MEGRPFENKTTFKFKVDDYNEYFLNQLFELLTEYGSIHEVWFDGAHPKRKGGQTYNYMAWKELIHKLAPEAVIFGKQDIRWCGNEAGATRETEWNIIPYPENPDEMNSFPDLRNEDLGSREKLYEAKYLRYQPAETNTSIREGWFYRDEHDQKVRSADDVFDIYERSVGGNSIFLLNIPPNREGKFSPEDVKVLKEVGKRISKTYSKNLLNGANGPEKMLDGNPETFGFPDAKNSSIEITCDKELTINRIMVQEAVATHSERIEKHAVDAWINGQWVEIASGTNVGYKRILRFPEITTGKLRIRILKSRLVPAISNISAYYYHTRPPQLEITRNSEGMVSIQPIKHTFGWKWHGENTSENLNRSMEIRYTTDGSEPTRDSDIFTVPFKAELIEIKAAAFNHNETGSIATKQLGFFKNQWKLVKSSSNTSKYTAEHSFDSDEKTYWSSIENSSGKHFISIDLGKLQTLNGFIYTPQTENRNGMIEKGTLSFSIDGNKWIKTESFEFGNLINDPSPRKLILKEKIKARYIKVESIEIAGGGKSAAIAEIDFY